VVVAVCRISLHLHGVSSLKEKRQLLKKIIERTKNRFNVSAAEVGSNDMWQKGEVGLSVIGNDASFVNSVMDTIINYIEDMHLAEIIESDLEVITL